MSTTSSRTFLPIIVLSLAVFSADIAAEEACAGFNEYSYICGIASAEDLVLIPDTNWVIASGFAGGVSLYLIDAEQKSWSEFYPASEPRARQDMTTYGACPGSPDPKGFVAHGLHIRPGSGGHSTLYVVGHGEREAIEVFDIDANGERPVLTWTGCVTTPDGMPSEWVSATQLPWVSATLIWVVSLDSWSPTFIRGTVALMPRLISSALSAA